MEMASRHTRSSANQRGVGGGIHTAGTALYRGGDGKSATLLEAPSKYQGLPRTIAFGPQSGLSEKKIRHPRESEDDGSGL